MENPATWGKAEQIVSDALNEAAAQRRRMVMGLSTVRQITDALRREGYLEGEQVAYERGYQEGIHRGQRYVEGPHIPIRHTDYTTQQNPPKNPVDN